MSDVREQLSDQIAMMYGTLRANKMADAILDRFDVVEKPVVTDQKLGELVESATAHGYDMPSLGAQMHRELWNAGLRIVKVEDDK